MNNSYTRNSRIIIDLQALRDNYRFLKSLSPESKLIAVIKADAYGHGALEAAQALEEADAFAVATVGEALQLREAGVSKKLMVLGGVINPVQMQSCIDQQVDIVIHQHWQIELLKNTDRINDIDIWVKFNSGMGRLGFSSEQIHQAVKAIEAVDSIGSVRLMTHLANADDITDDKSSQQVADVEALGLQEYEWGIANSAGLLGWPQCRKNWNRVGIALYGSDPLINQKYKNQLKPVMSFEARVVAINTLQAGQTVGYGGLYTCPTERTIAVVSVGYADGYPRHMQNGEVIIRGQRYPVVGRVSMDMITLDVSDGDVQAGDDVELWGANMLAEEVASKAETISYELFCNAGCHGKREYRN